MIPQNIVEQARSVNLFELLTQRGFSLEKEGNQFRLCGHQGLIVYENKWFQHSTGMGGNPIDLIIYLEKKSFKDAVYSLVGEKKEKMNNTDDPFHYLLHKRKIFEELLNDCFSLELIKVNRNNLYFYGYENPYDPNKAKCISWINTTNNQKGELKGSDKSYSFSLPDYNNTTNQRTLILAEGPIDILSIACLEVINRKKDFFQTYKIALCGLHQKNLFQRVKKLNPDNIHLALDNDPPGKQATENLKNSLKAIAPIKIIQYKTKDPNDLLLKIKN